jgi:hypothetical protein
MASVVAWKYRVGPCCSALCGVASSSHPVRPAIRSKRPRNSQVVQWDCRVASGAYPTGRCPSPHEAGRHVRRRLGRLLEAATGQLELRQRARAQRDTQKHFSSCRWSVTLGERHSPPDAIALIDGALSSCLVASRVVFLGELISSTPRESRWPIRLHRRGRCQ